MTDNNDTRRDLVLNVKNFGPIAEAKDIEIKPMTVFVGPSNTGKSYLAILLHAMLESRRDVSRTRFEKARRHVEEHLEGYEALLKDMTEQYDDDQHRRKFITLDQNMMSRRSIELIQIIQEEWLNELIKSFNSVTSNFFELSDIAELSVDQSGSMPEISVSSTDKEWELGFDVNSSVYDLGSIPLRFPDFVLSRLIDDDSVPESRRVGVNSRIGNQRIVYRLIRAVTSQYFNLMDSMYFPAARTGIIKSHKILTNNIIENLDDFGIQDRRFVSFDRISRNFLRHLLNTKNNPRINDTKTSEDVGRRSPVLKIADILEKSLIEGRIEISDEDIGNPEFYYIYKDIQVPMLLSSSMVTELAPIVLFLRNYAETGDLLIIEEPEAHLHPAAQQKMAAALALMVRNGLRVLITTHSYDMVEQIGTLVNASHADERQRHGIGLGDPSIEKDVYLIENEVGMYGFTPRDDGSGTDVIPIEIDQDYAYSPKSFSKALSDQFNRNSRFIKARINTE